MKVFNNDNFEEFSENVVKLGLGALFELSFVKIRDKKSMKANLIAENCRNTEVHFFFKLKDFNLR